eukprot:TRINITY_DN4211_c0_g1_i1.p1 TRINITY_DN4211_c0_g1~~TRINITY_DN4211_c0_g1_i1.p1  ORF type:complete len:380 (+),score=13.91 TRINITY_DN4211_c0_g1_i1:27-1166(+)
MLINGSVTALILLMWISVGTANIIVQSGALNGTQIQSAEFYKKGDDFTSVFESITGLLVDATSSIISDRIVYLVDVPKSQLWTRIFDLKSKGVIGIIFGSIYPVPGQDFCIWTGEDVSQIDLPISTVYHGDFDELHGLLLDGEQILIELSSEGNPWTDAIESVASIVVFRVILGGFSVALVIYGSYKLAMFIRLQRSRFNVPQVCLALEIIANLWRVMYLVVDPLGCNFVYGSAVNSFTDTVSIPYQIATFALVAFYWFEIINQASIKIYPFLNRLKIPFFVITFLLIAIDMTLSLIGFYSEFSTTTPMSIIYLVISFSLLIFYVITFIRLQRRMKAFGQARVDKKNIRTLSNVNMKMIFNAIGRLFVIIVGIAYVFLQ